MKNFISLIVFVTILSSSLLSMEESGGAAAVKPLRWIGKDDYFALENKTDISLQVVRPTIGYFDEPSSFYRSDYFMHRIITCPNPKIKPGKGLRLPFKNFFVANGGNVSKACLYIYFSSIDLRLSYRCNMDNKTAGNSLISDCATLDIPYGILRVIGADGNYNIVAADEPQDQGFVVVDEEK